MGCQSGNDVIDPQDPWSRNTHHVLGRTSLVSASQYLDAAISIL